MTLRYVVGDATHPEGDGPRVIVHCVNSLGAWGAGFVLALSRRWVEPERQYKELAASFGGRIPLGATQIVHVEEGLVVANLVGQEGVGHAADGTPPIRCPAIRTGLGQVREHAMRWAASAFRRRASIHMPRMGAGLAGGDWDRVAHLVHDELVERGLDVTVYDIPA